MDFGRLENIENVDFSFPPSHSGTVKILGGTKSKTLNVYVGAPIWNDDGFLGKIYPAKARSKDFLKYYGLQFNGIELNATHYRIPEKNIIERWAEVVPNGFKFCPKIHQSVSHSNDISNCISHLHIFYDHISCFGSKLGSCLLQLPPSFETKHINQLIELLDNSPISNLAVELRHPSWFNDIQRLNHLCNYLYQNNLSINITDVAGRRDVLHQRLTNKTAFVRFVANNMHPSDFKRLDNWIERFQTWIQAGLEDLYFFIHTPDKSLVPELATYFINNLNKTCGLEIALPKIENRVSENKLF